jgi:hypothetical protein
MASHGKNAKIFLSNFDISAYLNEAVTTKTADSNETTTFGAGSKTFLAGLGDGKIAIKGLFDGSANALDSIAQPLVGAADTTITIAEMGVATLGNPCKIANVQTGHYETSAPVHDVVSAAMEFQGDGGVDRGVILAGLRSTVFGTADNATGVDGLAATTNGGVAAVHVTGYALTGGTVTVKVQHSTDNTTFADLATLLNAVSAVGNAVVYVAPGTTVNRYLRAQITTTGSAGTVTTTLSFARR